MSFPEHPDTKIIVNEYYKKGLTEKQIYEYYQQNKSNILKETKDKNLMFYIFTDINKFIIRRKLKDNQLITLTEDNFSEVVTGRTVSIHSEFKRIEKEAIIDIDIANKDFKKIKDATSDVYEYLLNSFPLISNIEIRYTGKDGFHLFCNLKRSMNIDSIRFLFLKLLKNSPLSEKYDIGFKRTGDKVNLDLSALKYRGNRIVLGSLSEIGLKSMVVSFDKLKSFQKEMARI